MEVWLKDHIPTAIGATLGGIGTAMGAWMRWTAKRTEESIAAQVREAVMQAQIEINGDIAEIRNDLSRFEERLDDTRQDVTGFQRAIERLQDHLDQLPQRVVEAMRK
jgi:chromosome segregation ATPase